MTEDGTGAAGRDPAGAVETSPADPVSPPAAPAAAPKVPSRARRLWIWIRAPLLLFVLGFVVFSLFAWNRVLTQSAHPHFVLLANAFLKGTVEIRKQDIPPDVPSPHGIGKMRHDNDWASWEQIRLKDGRVLRGNFTEGSEWEEPFHFETLDGGLYSIRHERVDPAFHRERHYYVSFPPGPALLMVPLALIRGYHVNDVVFTLFFAALNVGLAYVVFRRASLLGITQRTPRENVGFALILAFGTVNLWCSVLGQVWFTALVVAMTAILLYLYACLDMERPLLAGLAMAFCVATRPQLGFAAILFGARLLFPEGRLRRAGWKKAFRDGAIFAAPIVVTGVLLGWYNLVRFDNPLVFGHEYLQNGRLDRIVAWGLFNYHFLQVNLMSAFTLLPKLTREYPHIIFSMHGMSMFLSTPILIYLAAPKYPEGDRTTWLWHRLLWATALAVAIPGFLYQNTGWEQYGFRFSMDWLAYLMLLIALSRRKFTWLFLTLAIIGFLVNAWGAISFQRGGFFEPFFQTYFLP